MFRRQVKPLKGFIYLSVGASQRVAPTIDYSFGRNTFVAAFSNFASSLRKINSTLPTGPLRCLAMMISATFCLIRILLILVGAIDEHDDIGILFQRARFAQIRKHGSFIGALFHGAG